MTIQIPLERARWRVAGRTSAGRIAWKQQRLLFVCGPYAADVVWRAAPLPWWKPLAFSVGDWRGFWVNWTIGAIPLVRVWPDWLRVGPFEVRW